MSIQFKNSQTKVNLMKAFAGESQARNRYTFAAEEAKKQGMHAIAEIFRFTAEQERAHAERFYELLKELSGKTIEITGGFPVDKYATLEELLNAAKHNEYEEYEDVYQEFAEKAKEEEFLEASSAFLLIAKVEKIHGDRFKAMADMLKDGSYFQRKECDEWMCLNCGHIHKGMMVPETCPLCRHEKGYFIPAEYAPYFSISKQTKK